jgi:hypothetical protein
MRQETGEKRNEMRNEEREVAFSLRNLVTTDPIFVFLENWGSRLYN